MKLTTAVVAVLLLVVLVAVVAGCAPKPKAADKTEMNPQQKMKQMGGAPQAPGGQTQQGGGPAKGGGGAPAPATGQ